jgi:hypothetical protein
MKNKALTLLLIFTIHFGGSPSAIACGPFVLDVLFSLKKHPDLPLEPYANGASGIVPSSFGPMSMVLFYRQLNGLNLAKVEQAQAVSAMENKIFYLSGADDPTRPGEGGKTKESALDQWLAARAKVTEEKVTVDSNKQDGYSYFTNCLPDSFRNATKTLEDRIAKHGVAADTKEWLKGQDAVFTNCGEAAATPENLTNGPDWLQKDRSYQIASAKFYQGKMRDARIDLDAIAADGNSIWRNTARFVAARTYVREASLLNSPEGEAPDKQLEAAKKASLQKAESALQQILRDDSISEFHRSAVRLLGLVKFRMTPDERRKELGTILTNPAENLNFYNDLTDYALFLNRITEAAGDTGREVERKEAEKAGKEYDYNYDLKLRDIPATERSDELTEWIFTYQAGDGGQASFDKWKQTGKLHWFVSAISKADAKSPQTAQLLAEAARIKRDSPAFATVRFHQIRLLIDGGNITEAKKKFDETGDLSGFPLSTQNTFMSQRAVFAADLEDYLKFAQRKPVIFSWNENDREEPASLDEDATLKPWANRTMFDADAAAFLNEKVPLSVLKKAAVSSQLPAHLKRMLVMAVWTRSFVLKNTEVEREFAPLIASATKDSTPLFGKYAATANAIDREAAALIAILRNPVIQPYIATGYGREGAGAPTEIDSIRGNWWCIENHADKLAVAFPSFLTAQQRIEARLEKDLMVAGGESATMLTRRALEFAAKNPHHEQTPEILHLAVRSTRYGCKDDSTGKYSKQAFDILHTRFKTSAWTKNTPYWFGQ